MRLVGESPSGETLPHLQPQSSQYLWCEEICCHVFRSQDSKPEPDVSRMILT